VPPKLCLSQQLGLQIRREKERETGMEKFADERGKEGGQR
jgi:hypothetical protein